MVSPEAKLECLDVQNYPDQFERFRDVVRYNRNERCMWKIDPNDWKSFFIPIEKVIAAGIDFKNITESKRS